MSSQDSLYQASTLAKQAYLQVAQIEPISPNASPRTQARFRSMLTDVTQACSQALEWTMGMSVVAGCEGNIGLGTWNDFLNDTNDDNETEDEDDEGEGEAGKQETEDEIVGRLVDAALDGDQAFEPDRAQYDIKDFVRMMTTGGYKGKVEEQERDSIMSMIFGYKCPSLIKIRTVFKREKVAPDSITALAKDALEIEAITDFDTRLFRRESLIFEGPKRDRVGAYLVEVLRNIAGLTAYEEWCQKDAPYRKRFVRQLARSLSRDAFEAIDQREDITPKHKSKLYSKLVSPVRKKLNKVMARREQFLKAFTEFGPHVLLDIVFCKTSSKGYPRQSKYFIRTWNGVYEAVEGKKLGERRYGENRKFTLRVLETLGGESVSRYAEKFLDKHRVGEWDSGSDSDETDEAGAE